MVVPKSERRMVAKTDDAPMEIPPAGVDADSACNVVLRLLYDACAASISLLYDAHADNVGMKTTTHRYRSIGWRATGMILAAMLFVLSIAELILRPGADAAIWRGLALSSLYLVMCLSQRRLFAPARARSHWHRYR